MQIPGLQEAKSSSSRSHCVNPICPGLKASEVHRYIFFCHPVTALRNKKLSLFLVRKLRPREVRELVQYT